VERGADLRGSVAGPVLIVDDEQSMRQLLERVFTGWGHDVVAVDSGLAALAALHDRRFQLLVCDERMPGMQGSELLVSARAIDPDLAIIMLTAVNDASVATKALKSGALDFITKPFELEELGDRVAHAIRRRELDIEQRRVERVIREEVALRTEELQQEQEALRRLTIRVAETLINAMEAKDIYLRGHSQRVADLGASIASQLDLDDDTVEDVRLAGRLHDVGKIGIREAVLNKPDRLSADEYAHVKDHVRIGVEILSPLQHIRTVLEYVHDHHEHWDGSGYPRGRAGEEISIGGRILAAADTFDAITSTRAYRGSLSAEGALAAMKMMVGTHIHPTVFDALRRVIETRQALPFVDDRR
jgi:response regulator RpfG family c-di-GMP phosphodiesterase